MRPKRRRNACSASNLVTIQTGPEGAPVNQVLVEELADISRELYLALTVDRVERQPVMLVSSSGGMDIEEVAATNPEDIHTEPIDPVLGLMPYQSRRLASRLGLAPSLTAEAARVLNALYRIFVDNDCTLVEVNPLIVTGEGRLVALDAKISLDDDSMFRHTDLQQLRDSSQEDELEAQAADLDIAYVQPRRRRGLLGQRRRAGHGDPGRYDSRWRRPGQLSGRGRGSQRRKSGQRRPYHPVRLQGEVAYWSTFLAASSVAILPPGA